MKLATLCYVIDKKRNATLMIHRVKKKNDYHLGKWNGLGGKFEIGESPEECAKREIKEESGLILENLNLKGFITFPLFDGNEDWYVFLFTSNEFSGNLIDSSEGNLKWISNDKLTTINLWEGDKYFIPWLFEDKFFSAKFIYKNGQYINHQVNFY